MCHRETETKKYDIFRQFILQWFENWKFRLLFASDFYEHVQKLGSVISRRGAGLECHFVSSVVTPLVCFSLPSNGPISLPYLSTTAYLTTALKIFFLNKLSLNNLLLHWYSVNLEDDKVTCIFGRRDKLIHLCTLTLKSDLHSIWLS